MVSHDVRYIYVILFPFTQGSTVENILEQMTIKIIVYRR